VVNIYWITRVRHERFAKRNRMRPQLRTGVCIERPHIIRHREQIDDVVFVTVAHLHSGNIKGLCLYIRVVTFKL